MRYFGIAILIILIVSCQSEFTDSNTQITDITGKWQLLEVLMDPGDGSGEFGATDLDIILEIDNSFNVQAKGLLCGYNNDENILTGKMSLKDSIITANCENGAIRHKLLLSESNLILSNLNCREACRAKLVKIK